MTQEYYNELSGIILDASISVHKEMGPGLLESVYQQCLMRELYTREIKFETTVVIPLIYKGYIINKDYIMDLLVEDEIVVELKACGCILPVHEAQIIII